MHPDLVDAAERYLETTDLHLYKVELWAKYAGAVNYDQPLHRDYGSHSLVVPRPEPRYQQITTFIYLSDVTEEDGPTVIVPYDAGKDIPYTPLYIPFGELAESEVRCVGPAGSLLVYRTDILHRGSNFTADGRSRFSILVDFQVRGTTWGGKMAWPKQSPERWAKFIPQCTVRQRDLFGFPRPGDPYWTEETLAGVAQRYPGYRPRAVSQRRGDGPPPGGMNGRCCVGSRTVIHTRFTEAFGLDAPIMSAPMADGDRRLARRCGVCGRCARHLRWHQSRPRSAVAPRRSGGHPQPDRSAVRRRLHHALPDRYRGPLRGGTRKLGPPVIILSFAPTGPWIDRAHDAGCPSYLPGPDDGPGA